MGLAKGVGKLCMHRFACAKREGDTRRRLSDVGLSCQLGCIQFSAKVESCMLTAQAQSVQRCVTCLQTNRKGPWGLGL